MSGRCSTFTNFSAAAGQSASSWVATLDPVSVTNSSSVDWRKQRSSGACTATRSTIVWLQRLSNRFSVSRM